MSVWVANQPVHAGSVERHAGGLRAGARARALVCCLLTVWSFAGCRESDELEVTYGQRRGAAAGSVNGTRVLSDMFQQAGYHVSTRRYLAEDLQQYDVIVWAPNEFSPPGEETLKFFDDWLSSQEARTLVYIGRDYDAAPHYWDAVLSSAPASDRIAVLRRHAQAAAQYDVDRLSMPAAQTMEWFTLQRDHPQRIITQLEGPWSAGIDVTRTDIRTRGLLQVPTSDELRDVWGDAEPLVFRRPDHEVLLSDGKTTLVSRTTKPAWGDGQVLVITNGSFLLNLPLVNHEHRKLAGRLIQQCEPSTRVAFLESGPGDPLVSDPALSAQVPADQRERVLLVAQWCVWGLVFCFCVFPIFGRPRTLPDAAPSEFVQHVDALGELLHKTRDVQFARRKLEHYHTITRRDLNVRRRESVPAVGWPGGTRLEPKPTSQPDTHA